MKSNSKKRSLRWAVLVVVILNVLYNYVYQYLPFIHKSVKDISDQHANLFSLSGYAFSIWGLIYLSFLIYGIYQLLPKQRLKMLYDRIANPLILANLLGICWITFFALNMIGWSVFIMLITLVNALFMFRLVRNRIQDKLYSSWLTVPFSLYSGWISVATIANISIWLVSMGWHGGALGETAWAIILVVIAAIIGITTSLKYKDWIYTAVIAWATIAICTAHIEYNKTLAYTALCLGLALALWSLGFATYSIRNLIVHKT